MSIFLLIYIKKWLLKHLNDTIQIFIFLKRLYFWTVMVYCSVPLVSYWTLPSLPPTRIGLAPCASALLRRPPCWWPQQKTPSSKHGVRVLTQTHNVSQIPQTLAKVLVLDWEAKHQRSRVWIQTYLSHRNISICVLEDQNFWSCDFVGSYHNLKPTNCSFSADSSLLAVSFQEVITIWSPDTWEMLTTLCQPPGIIRCDMLFYHSGYCKCSLASKQPVQTLSNAFGMGFTGFLRSLDVYPIQSGELAFTKLFTQSE